MEMIAACGLDCSSCPAYVNRNTTDQEVLEKVAAEWSDQLHQEIKPENVPCDGCQLVGEVRLSPYCYTCAIRACAHGKGYVTCAECGEYEACTTLQKFIAETPSAGLTLASLRQR
jgi:RecJ-like exonuclease